MDTGKGVLCERCWKIMYLPKVIISPSIQQPLP
jgi:hypothetical protein